MQWSHMNERAGRGAAGMLAQLETPRHPQFWCQAQTHDNDHTCVVAEPTDLEVAGDCPVDEDAWRRA